MNAIVKIPSPLGVLTIAGDGKHLTGLWMEDQKYFAAALDSGAEEKALPLFEDVSRWLSLYFQGTQPDFSPPLAPSGSPFRRAVLEKLCAIPYGEVTTYGAIARQLEQETGKHVSARAVGGAVGHNPISLLIPCHRVVGRNGSLTGYAGGLQRKRFLLALEQIPMDEKETRVDLRALETRG